MFAGVSAQVYMASPLNDPVSGLHIYLCKGLTEKLCIGWEAMLPPSLVWSNISIFEHKMPPFLMISE
jgi:hypothetical protein